MGRPGNCSSCGARLTPGAEYCTKCGEAVNRGGSRVSFPWVIAGAAIVIAIAVVVMPYARGRRVTTADPLAPPVGTGPGQLAPLSGTPRQQADQLFNRIMQEQSQGNVDQARFFVPMAIQAYQAAGILDADGLYHLSLIQAVGSDYPAARATAERILEAAPTHLLGLAALAQAAEGEGDTATAQDAWRRFLENLATEQAKALTEYTDHAAILPQYEQDARAATGS